jgi:hypothetical protein
MQHETGVTSKATGLNLNMAIEWRRVGHATTAVVGAIAVWAHHVGKLVGKTADGRWILRSGNNGSSERDRPIGNRYFSRAVAFRSL